MNTKYQLIRLVYCLILWLSGATVLSAQPVSEYLIYVSNEDSNDLSVIDSETLEVIDTIAVGKRPRGVRVSPDGRFVFAALSGLPKCPPTMPDEQCEAMAVDKTQDGIAMVDAATRALIRVLPGGSDPEQFDIHPDQTRLFVSNEDTNTASIIDIASGRVLHTVPVGVEPEGVKVSPSGHVFLVTSESDHEVAVVDSMSGKLIARIEVGLRPRDAVFSADGSRAFISAELSRHVAIIDTASWQRVDQIAVSDTALPMGLAVTEDASTLYVANGRERTVSKINVNQPAVIATVEVGTRPWGLALSPDDARLFSANGPSNDVSVIDTATMKLIATIAAGASPWGVAIGPRQ